MKSAGFLPSFLDETKKKLNIIMLFFLFKSTTEHSCGSKCSFISFLSFAYLSPI